MASPEYSYDESSLYQVQDGGVVFGASLNSPHRRVPINDLITLSGSIGQESLPEDIWLDIRFPLRVFRPIFYDNNYSYAGCSYSYHPVKAEDRPFLREVLDALTSRAFFGLHQGELRQNSIDRTPQHHVYLLRKLSNANANMDPLERQLPEDWLRDLGGQNLEEIWLLGGVRVTKDGTPINRLQGLVPVAFTADGSMYFTIEETYEGWFRKTIAVRGEVVFDLTLCNDSQSTYRKAMDILSLEIERAFAAPPVGATRDLTTVRRERELILSRKRQKSLVISSSPLSSAREITTYTIRWYPTDDRYSDSHGRFATESWPKDDASVRFVVLSIEMNLLVSADGVYYVEEFAPRELLDEFVARYEVAIGNALRVAIARTLRNHLAEKARDVNGVIQLREDL